MATAVQLDSRDELQLDTRVEIVTPENIAFQYRIAGPFRRLPAYLLDCLFRGLFVFLVLLGLGFTIGSLGATGIVVAVVLVVWFVLSWFYGGLFETYWNGQTPGKYLLGLRVLTVAGEPITAWQAILRNILREADALPWVGLPGAEDGHLLLPAYMFGLFSCLATRRYQRLGDLVAGTMVVVEQRDLLSGVAPVADQNIILLAGALPVSLPVSRSLARALAAYVGRRSYFSPSRREELSRPLGEAIAERYQLPVPASYDQLLCAVYFRVFIADRAEMQSPHLPVAPVNSGPVAVAIGQPADGSTGPVAWLEGAEGRR